MVLTQMDIARRARLFLITRAAGVDTHPTPQSERLHAYWVLSPEGQAKWVDSPTPWRTLFAHLVKFMPPEKAKRVTSRWFIEHFGYAAGSDKNRVAHGFPPRGKRVGPG